MNQTQLSLPRGNFRRRQRVIVRIRVKVISHEEGPALSEDTRTIVVNARGALIALAIAVRPGEMLTLKNLVSTEERKIRVIGVGERQMSPREVSVEFTTPAPHFWHIDFPPADWKILQDLDPIWPT